MLRHVRCISFDSYIKPQLLRTSLRTKHIFLRTIIASIYECDFREENHMVVGHFKRYFKYTLYIIAGRTHQNAFASKSFDR